MILSRPSEAVPPLSCYAQDSTAWQLIDAVLETPMEQYSVAFVTRSEHKLLSLFILVYFVKFMYSVYAHIHVHVEIRGQLVPVFSSTVEVPGIKVVRFGGKHITH